MWRGHSCPRGRVPHPSLILAKVGILIFCSARRIDSSRTAIGSNYSRRAKAKICQLLSLAHLQHREERFLRNIYPADALHALLAFLLFL